MRHRLPLVVIALVSGTACGGVRTGASAAAPLPADSARSAAAPTSTAARRPAQPPPSWDLERPRTVPTPLTEACIAHPGALTAYARECGFVTGTTRGALAALHNGLDDWGRPLSSFLPDSSGRPMHFALTGSGGRSVSLQIKPDSLGLFGYEDDRHVAWTRFATARAPLVSVSRSDMARDTTHFRAVLDSIEIGIRLAGGVLVGCRRERVPFMDDNQRHIAVWRLPHDVITVWASLDSMDTIDTLSARWTIERTASIGERTARIEPGCVTPARVDMRTFAAAAAKGYASPRRAAFRFRQLVYRCEVTRASGVVDHPLCDGVPSAQEYLEKWPQPTAERKGPPPPWLTAPPPGPVP